MSDLQTKIVKVLEKKLQSKKFIHAMWLEGSIAQLKSDEYSDIDLWLEVDQPAIDKTFNLVKKSLGTIGPIDLEYEIHKNNDQKHIIYHIAGTSEFLTVDVNIQPYPWENILTIGIDEIKVIFNKDVNFKHTKKNIKTFNEDKSKIRIMNYYKAMKPNIMKNLLRNKPLEAMIYYENIIEMGIKYLRLKKNLCNKTDFNFKHVYSDLSKQQTKKIEELRFVKPVEIEKNLPNLEKWLENL